MYLLQFLLEAFSMRIPNRTSIFQDWAHQFFITASLTSWGQENKFFLKNTSVLLALVQIVFIWVFHLRSFVIVTPRYLICLMLSTFSNTVRGSKVNVFLKFQCIFYCSNFTVTNTVISKKPDLRVNANGYVIYVLGEHQWTENGALRDTRHNRGPVRFNPVKLLPFAQRNS